MLSDSPCIEGQSWGTHHGLIWVDRGCRARFAADWNRGGGWGGPGRGDSALRCESINGRTRQCPLGFRGRAVLTRQLSDSACVEGRSWGQRGGTLWVNQGCRGKFDEGRGGGWGPGPGHDRGTVTCSSDGNRRHICDWDSRNGRPVVVKQLSNTACIEGRTWAYLRGQI